jgi:hypothetical protein
VIDRLELLELAREFSLRPDVVEKDYALPSSLLMGYLYQHFGAGLAFTFWGGSCRPVNPSSARPLSRPPSGLKWGFWP